VSVAGNTASGELYPLTI